MSLEWTDDLILGIEELDRQHRVMFDHFNRLSLACHGAEKGVLLEQLDALERLLHLHFETEERLMAEHGYPALAAQRSEHERLAQTLGEMGHVARSTGPSRMLGAQVAGSMVQWIVRHIRQHDHELARYLKQRPVSE